MRHARITTSDQEGNHGARTSLEYGVMALLVWVALIAVAPAFASGTEAWYTVRRGDSLSVIGARFGVSVAALKRDNALQSDLLAIGQRLRMQRPFRLTKARNIKWERPFSRTGRIVRKFGPYKGANNIIMPRTGSDMLYPVGGAVSCPANGVVRYHGPVDGFGTLVIVEHGGGMATVLAPLKEVAWQVGQAVRRGDLLGVTDEPPAEGQSYLHLELRRNDKAIPPDRLLK